MEAVDLVENPSHRNPRTFTGDVPGSTPYKSTKHEPQFALNNDLHFEQCCNHARSVAEHVRYLLAEMSGFSVACRDRLEQRSVEGHQPDPSVDIEEREPEKRFSTDSEGEDAHEFVPGPLFPLKQQLDRDKEDESLQRWKEQLLGRIDFNLNEDNLEPKVTVLSLGIISKDRPDIVLMLPLDKRADGVCFSLKEGSSYSLKFAFTVHNNIVSGLTYANTVWKNGIQVEQIRVMLGTFSPQQEPYVHIIEEETAPAGVLARGSYTAKAKFVDDDGRCHLEMCYSFEIRKDW